MGSLSTTYNKAVIMALTIIVAVAPQILSQASALGLNSVVANWVSIVGGVAGTLLMILTGNKNSVTLTPGTSVVAEKDIAPGATPIAQHKP